jgi:hypothetical protein
MARSPLSVVGHSAALKLATEVRSPQTKFPPEDDALLVKLKVTMTEVERDRSAFSGRRLSIQRARYYTKWGVKTIVWTMDVVSRYPISEDDRD